MGSSTLTYKGQTTIPKQVREHLHLEAGDRIEFVLADDGVYLRPATRDVTDLKGFLPKPKKTLSLQDIEDVIRQRSKS